MKRQCDTVAVWYDHIGYDDVTMSVSERPKNLLRPSSSTPSNRR